MSVVARNLMAVLRDAKPKLGGEAGPGPLLMRCCVPRMNVPTKQ